MKQKEINLRPKEWGRSEGRYSTYKIGEVKNIALWIYGIDS
jgi:hypothetical protein